MLKKTKQITTTPPAYIGCHEGLLKWPDRAWNKHSDAKCELCPVSAGTLLENNSGRDHGWWPWREPRSCDYRPRGQWDGDYSLEPDAGHSEEARVHVAPPAQDLVLIFPSLVNETLCSSCSFHLCPWGATVSLKDKKFWLTPYLHTRGRNLKSQCQTGAGSDWIAPQLSVLCLFQVTDCECGSYMGNESKTDGIIIPSLLLCNFL